MNRISMYEAKRLGRLWAENFLGQLEGMVETLSKTPSTTPNPAIPMADNQVVWSTVETTLESSASFAIESPLQSYAFPCENELLPSLNNELTTPSVVDISSPCKLRITDSISPGSMLPETQQLL